MTETDMKQLDKSDLATQVEDWEVDSETTDGATEQKETTYLLADWSDKFGYYKHIPELHISIDSKATWTVGKGFKADEPTTILLEMIKGIGADTFNTIIENMIRTYHIAGDAYAEIVRDPESKVLVNLKPLDPSTIRIVANRAGKIIRYEQVAKIGGKNMKKKISMDKIFHLSRNRVADEIHGQSVITEVEDIIKMRNEAMNDWKRVLHRNIDPLWIFHLDTDDTTTIAAFKAKMDAARGEGENMYIPKGAVVPELVSTATNATLNPQSWIESLNRYFFQAVGTPAIIVGNSASLTEASAKMEYLVWQQTIEEEQLYIEEQALSQLNVAIQLEFPARLENELLSGTPAQQKPQVNAPQIQQNEKANEGNDTTAEVQGNR